MGIRQHSKCTGSRRSNNCCGNINISSLQAALPSCQLGLRALLHSGIAGARNSRGRLATPVTPTRGSDTREPGVVTAPDTVGGTPSPEPVYKDVVVIGNGPSAIALSFMLSGNWPYYNAKETGNQHPTDFLHMRLTENVDESIVTQDLQFLSEGLEGRSGNPVSLLFDTLTHPQADLGVEMPSFLSWRHDPARRIDHVVLGKGLPGGAWQAMDGNVLTISLGGWMELPALKFQEWETTRGPPRGPTGKREKRAPVASVARYYQDYVELQGLTPYFESFAMVTSAKPLPGSDRWQVDGVRWAPAASSGGGAPLCQDFRYITQKVVLATGGYDLPNRLNVPGEDLPFVVKSLQALEALISSGALGDASDPLLVVGAGLSAADAIIAAHFRNIPVTHVFRKACTDPSLIFRQLPANMYPEYHKVYQMMVDRGKTYSNYKPLEQHHVVKVLDDRRVFLQGPDCCGVITVSYVVVLIGSRPDLSFLPHRGADLGIKAGQSVSCRTNPVDVDVYSMESTKLPGLYAMGPLVADNFVRFAQGSALAITGHLHRNFGAERTHAAGCST